MKVAQLQVTRAGNEEDMYVNIDSITHFHMTKGDRTAVYLVNKEQAITVNHTIEEFITVIEGAGAEV